MFQMFPYVGICIYDGFIVCKTEDFISVSSINVLEDTRCRYTLY